MLVAISKLRLELLSDLYNDNFGLFQILNGLRCFWRENPPTGHEMRVDLREIQLSCN